MPRISAMILLATLGACTIAENEWAIEIFLNKYKALGLSEIDEVRNDRYEFRFCACDGPSTDHETTSNCTCSETITGRTAQKSVPFALFSTSCIHNPNDLKCLIARIPSSINQSLIYVKISIGSFVLSNPAYQPIKNTRFKHTESIKCDKQVKGKSQNLISCNNGFIELTYVSLMKSSNDGRRRTINDQTPVEKSEKLNELTEKQMKKNFSVHSNMFEFKTMNQIKQFLLENAKKKHISASEFNSKSFKKALLDVHNLLRSKHDAHPVKIDSEIERSAQAWAQHLANGELCLEHDSNKKYGENLFFYATDLIPDEATLALMTARSFYLEAFGYNYRTHHDLNYKLTGHFTQLVWDSSTRIGIGVALKKFNGHQISSCQPSFPGTIIYVVVKYDPPGNIHSLQAYEQNVHPVAQ